MRRWALWIAVSMLALAIFAVRLLGPRFTIWTESAGWREIETGLQVRTLSGMGVGGSVKVSAVRADVAHWSLRVVDAHQGVACRGAIASERCPQRGAVINASFFDVETLTPIGLVITDGQAVSPAQQQDSWFGKWGVFYLDGKTPVIMPMEAALPSHVQQAVQAGPILVKQKQIPSFTRQLGARRAGVGIDTTGRLLLAVADGDITLEQWARCMRDQLECRDALNLDGGPSAQLAVQGKERIVVEVGESVPVFLMLTPLEN